jgi:hypothetical protein
MAAFTIAPASNKWFFHVKGASVFRNGDETIGSTDARISMKTARHAAPDAEKKHQPVRLVFLFVPAPRGLAVLGRGSALPVQ